MALLVGGGLGFAIGHAVADVRATSSVTGPGGQVGPGSGQVGPGTGQVGPGADTGTGPGGQDGSGSQDGDGAQELPGSAGGATVLPQQGG